MAIITLSVPDTLAAEWKRKANLTPATFAVDALTFYNWAVNEHANGRSILSADKNGAGIARVSTPLLDNVPVNASCFQNFLRPKR